MLPLVSNVRAAFSMWTEWSFCSRTCGGGVSMRSRECLEWVEKYLLVFIISNILIPFIFVRLVCFQFYFNLYYWLWFIIFSREYYNELRSTYYMYIFQLLFKFYLFISIYFSPISYKDECTESNLFQYMVCNIEVILVFRFLNSFYLL